MNNITEKHFNNSFAFDWRSRQPS